MHTLRDTHHTQNVSHHTMKFIYLILISLSFSTFSFGQLINDVKFFQKNIINNSDSIYLESKYKITNIDSVFENRKKLDDGEYVIFKDSIKPLPVFRIYVENGNINGIFCQYSSQGFLETIGGYKNDSLWTFRKLLNDVRDTTFRVGKWSGYARLYSGFSKNFYWQQYWEVHYKIPYDSNGQYFENWYHNGGQIWQQRIYEKTKGLVGESLFDHSGCRLSSFDKYEQTEIEKEWNTAGYLKSIKINGKMNYWISFMRDKETLTHYKLETSEDKMELLSIGDEDSFQTRFFYPNGQLKEFYDEKAGIRIIYNEKGEVLRIEKRKGVQIEIME